ncbi:MAG: FG-GAP-like repeat-containing protein [Ardenticatenales bacterium]
MKRSLASGALVFVVLVLPTVAAAAAHAALRADRPLFTLDLGAPSFGGGAVADLDGDGRPEVLVGTYYHDERVLALRSDGTLLWQRPSGGGPVDDSVTVADLDGDGVPEVLWGNSGSTVFHVADATGHDRWTKTIGEVLDAPAAVADMDGDGRLDIVLASCGSAAGGGLRAFAGDTGRELWHAERGGCYQSAPLLLDQDGNGRLDVVVSTWFDNKVRAFSGQDGTLRWETTIGGWTYHAGAFGDLNGDGVPDVALGDYSGTLWALDGRSGAVLWSEKLEGVTYVFGPTAMGDLDGDGATEVVVAADNVQVFDAHGRRRLKLALPGYGTRGPALADVDDDGHPDIVVASDGPALTAFAGTDGRVLFSHSFPDHAAFDFQPTVADLDGDGVLDVFGVFGRGQSDTPEQNWGRAVALRLGGHGPGWVTYSHDLHHSGNYGYLGGTTLIGTRTPWATAPTGTPKATATTAPRTASPSRTPTATSQPVPTRTSEDSDGSRCYLPSATR